MAASLKDNSVKFEMSMIDEFSMVMNCSDFLFLREDEEKVFKALFNNLPKTGAVLDYGCGMGRHLAYIRKTFPDINLDGLEPCELMRNYCKKSINFPSNFFESFDEIKKKIVNMILFC